MIITSFDPGKITGYATLIEKPLISGNPSGKYAILEVGEIFGLGTNPIPQSLTFLRDIIDAADEVLCETVVIRKITLNRSGIETHGVIKSLASERGKVFIERNASYLQGIRKWPIILPPQFSRLTPHEKDALFHVMVYVGVTNVEGVHINAHKISSTS